MTKLRCQRITALPAGGTVVLQVDLGRAAAPGGKGGPGTLPRLRRWVCRRPGCWPVPSAHPVWAPGSGRAQVPLLAKCHHGKRFPNAFPRGPGEDGTVGQCWGTEGQGGPGEDAPGREGGGGDLSLALSHRSCWRGSWVSGAGSRSGRRGTSQGTLVSPAATTHSGPSGEVPGLSVVKEEASAWCHRMKWHLLLHQQRIHVSLAVGLASLQEGQAG